MKRHKIVHNKPTLALSDIEKVSAVLNSGWVAQGEKVKMLEETLCNYLGVDGYGVAVSSGTAALYLALFALGIDKGDEVILPTYVCSALLNAIFFVGAIPVLVDVNLDDFNISFKKVKKKITKKTKAIIVPHIYGVPSDIDKFLGLGIPIIEDCAQSVGARINGQMVGTFGDISVFSFYATKLFTTGQGGMVVSRKLKLIKKIKDFREFDCRKKYKRRFNFQMTDIQAALGISQLKKLSSLLRRRREIATKYMEILRKSNNNFTLQEVNKGKERVWYRFVLRSGKGVKKTQKLFKDSGIQTIVPIRTYELLHRYLKVDKKDFKNSEELAETTTSIPVYPSLKKEEVLRIIRIMRKI